MDAGLQQSNALYATGMNEKEIESADKVKINTIQTVQMTSNTVHVQKETFKQLAGEQCKVICGA